MNPKRGWGGGGVLPETDRDRRFDDEGKQGPQPQTCENKVVDNPGKALRFARVVQCVCLLACGCVWNAEIEPYGADSGEGSSSQQRLSSSRNRSDGQASLRPQIDDPTLAGGKVVLRDRPPSLPLQWNVNPNQFPRTSSRSEEFNLRELLSYRGPSFECDSIENGMVYLVNAATESNYRAIDVLLSAVEIPFLIYVPGQRFGPGFRDNGKMVVLVNRENYREAAKLLRAAIDAGVLEDIQAR